MIPKIPESSPVETGSSSSVTTRREGRREEADQQQTEQRERVQSVVESRPPISTSSSTASPSTAPVSLEKRGGWFDSIKDSAKAYVANTFLRSNAENFITEKNRLISEAKALMQTNLRDPQYIALVDMLNLIIWPELEKMLDADQSKTGLALQSHKEVIKAIIEINLARGFANLSQTVAENRYSIPHYDDHPSLVNVFLTLCQRGSHHINRDQLATVEERYRPDRAAFQQLRRELMPAFIAKQNDLIQPYLNAYVKVANVPTYSGYYSIQKKQKDKVDIICNLFSTLSPTMPDHIKQDFLKKLEKAYNNPEDLQQLSEKLANEIVNNLIHESIHTSDDKRKLKIVNSLFPTNDTLLSSKNAFTSTLSEIRGHQDELRQLFDHLAEEILTELFPEKVNSLYLSTNLTYIPGIKSAIYNNIKAPLTDLLIAMYEPLENDLVRNSTWENELRSKVGSQDLHLLMETPAALLLGLTKNVIQTSPDAVGSIAEFLGSQLVPPPPKESELSQPPAIIPLGVSDSSQPSTSSPSLDEETKSRVEAARKQQLLLAQLTQGQLAEWIVDSIRVLLHSEDPRLIGFGGFIKQAFDNLTLALMAKGTELAFSGEVPSTSSSSSSEPSTPETQINEHLFFKELADRITPKLQSVLSDSKISEGFWKDLLRDLPLPQFAKDLLMPLLLKKAEEIQESLQLHPTSAPGATAEMGNRQERDTESTLRGYKGGDELISILDKIAEQIIDKAVESNLGLIAEYGFEDKIDEWMDIYLPGVEITESLKKWFSNNVSALGIGAEGTSAQSIAVVKRGITTVLQEAVINTIEKNFGQSSENYAAQLLSNIHTAFRKAFANYDASTREQIIAGQAIQAEIRRLESQIKALSQLNVQIKTQSSTHSTHLTKDQMTTLEGLQKARLRFNRGQFSIVDLERRLDQTLAKLNRNFPDAPWTRDQLVLIQSSLGRITPAALQDPAERSRLIYNTRSRIDHSERRSEQGDVELLRILQMPADRLQLLSEGLNLISTLKHAEKEMHILGRELQTSEQAYARIDTQEMTQRETWNSLVSLQDSLVLNRKTIGELNQQIERLNEELDGLLPVFKVLSKELTALLGLGEKEKLQLPTLLRDKIWPIIETAKESSIARQLFMHITPLILPIFDIPQNRQRLQELTQGDAFLNQLSHAFGVRAIARIPDFITSYKPFAKELLVLMGIEEPSTE
ncbi:MAG: hypothetical protein ACHQUC_08280, partial [Chlamydiales bacterium]